MLLKEVLKELIFDLEIKKYSTRTIKSYKNNNTLLFSYLENEFDIIKLEELKRQHIKSYFQYSTM